MGNQATTINPADIGIKITSHGSDWYWAVFSLFGLAALVHSFFAIRYNKKSDKFKFFLHVGPLLSASTLAYTYYTLASNLGWTGVDTEFTHIQILDNVRQIFYARYIGWFLAFPGLLYIFELNSQSHSVLTSDDLLHIINNLILQVVSWETFVLGLLIGALISSTYKWGYWTFGIAGQIFGLAVFIQRQLFGTSSATNFTILIVPFFILTNILYPVNWGLSEGGNVIQPDSEGVFYGILDIINFLIIPVVLIFDAKKNGSYVQADHTSSHDVEKVAASPEIRASGETQVHDGDHDVSPSP